MKLSEIHLIPDQDTKRYQLSNFSKEEQIGTSEGGTKIVRLKNEKDQRITMYGLYSKTDQFLSGVIGYFHQLNNGNYFWVIDVYTPPENRKRGYATTLYVSLIKKYHLKFVSDKQQTQQGRNLWNSIGTVVDVKVFDANTNQIVPRTQVSDADIYQREPERYLLIAEQSEQSILNLGLQIDIIEDYQVYTHPNNVGLFE